MTSEPTKKTVYFIRHAESDENRRLISWFTVFKTLAKPAWPTPRDVRIAYEMADVKANQDTQLSSFGKKQIQHMAKLLREANFYEKAKIDVVAYSPLVRARETAEGMLLNNDPKAQWEVQQLDCLLEKVFPTEWIFKAPFVGRMRALEEWIGKQQGTTIALAGHSQFFKTILKLNYKFGNCDVMKATFDTANNEWSGLTEVHKCTMQTESLLAATKVTEEEEQWQASDMFDALFWSAKAPKDFWEAVWFGIVSLGRGMLGGVCVLTVSPVCGFAQDGFLGGLKALFVGIFSFFVLNLLGALFGFYHVGKGVVRSVLVQPAEKKDA